MIVINDETYLDRALIIREKEQIDQLFIKAKLINMDGAILALL